MLEVSFAAALFGGLISFLSPCVLPLVPPYLSYLAGVTLDEMQARDDWAVRRRAILTALLFVAGFTTVFVLLGATASALGKSCASTSACSRTLAGVAIIVMGLHFMGLFRIGFLYREARLSATKSVGVWGAYVMGLAFAFGWTPCIGPILAAILAVAGSETSVWRGAALLAVYSAGLGVPFLLAALAMEPFVALLKRMRSRFGYVEKAMGALLVLTGIGFLSGWVQTRVVLAARDVPGRWGGSAEPRGSGGLGTPLPVRASGSHAEPGASTFRPQKAMQLRPKAERGARQPDTGLAGRSRLAVHQPEGQGPARSRQAAATAAEGLEAASAPEVDMPGDHRLPARAFGASRPPDRGGGAERRGQQIRECRQPERERGSAREAPAAGRKAEPRSAAAAGPPSPGRLRTTRPLPFRESVGAATKKAAPRGGLAIERVFEAYMPISLPE